MGEAKRRAMREENRRRIDAAYGPGAHGQMMRMITPQLCIVLMKRLGGNVSIPVSELDDTGGDLLALSLNDGVFHFQLEKKS